MLIILCTQVFLGNKNADTVVMNQVKPTFEAVTVRLHPQTWHRWISMRVELYGCPGILDQFVKLFFAVGNHLSFHRVKP